MEKEFGKLKNILIKKVDVTKYDEMHAALEEAEKTYGPCDCLINNAGVFFGGNVDEQKMEEFDKMLQVNVFGVLHGIKCVLKGMKERKRGTIINISSLTAKGHYDSLTVYGASKSAVSAISEGLRAEVATSGIKVTTICPGFVQTEILEAGKGNKELYDAYKDWAQALPNGPLLPEDIADVCLYIYKLPKRACIRDLVITSVDQTI
ncbi:hypothetical protein RFI_26658 [Reticulomyxa filosa]|uniref:Uncharacterized protein n=1 Tax=Reticulomyxa filosa TaxID=46433 RepID=X6MB63_RETFI|nr:hypothetical protein RFI_26658 [Reticulomyxa filosa]|eukprot:ETO10717.1 hypothetical protein RFI_26658 [Reticulomyxa filosa]